MQISEILKPVAVRTLTAAASKKRLFHEIAELAAAVHGVDAAQTVDAKIAELIDQKAGLAARALDGSDEEVGSSADVQLEALVALLTDALTKAA